jgi:glycosyltransferase involved in cell wall biosynthesis
MNMAAPWLDIFLLCHNRPESTQAAIESILAQRGNGFRLIVSDNSSDTRVAEMVARNFPDVRIVQRGCMPALAHFNACIAEAAADYFCLFHDDDLMGPDFVDEMRLAVEHFPDAVAIGANAWEVNLQSGCRKLSVYAFGRNQRITSARDLFRRYFGRHQTGFVPFPAYIYRTAVAGQQRIPASGGKYADVSWLLNLAQLGPLVWWRRPLMDYHLHGGNDGMQESRRDRLAFLGFLKQNPAYCGASGLREYRYFIYKKFLPLDAVNLAHQTRAQNFRSFLRWQKLRRRLRLSDLPALLRKTLLKTWAKVMT